MLTDRRAMWLREALKNRLFKDKVPSPRLHNFVHVPVWFRTDRVNSMELSNNGFLVEVQLLQATYKA